MPKLVCYNQGGHLGQVKPFTIAICECVWLAVGTELHLQMCLTFHSKFGDQGLRLT